MPGSHPIAEKGAPFGAPFSIVIRILVHHQDFGYQVVKVAGAMRWNSSLVSLGMVVALPRLLSTQPTPAAAPAAEPMAAPRPLLRAPGRRGHRRVSPVLKVRCQKFGVKDPVTPISLEVQPRQPQSVDFTMDISPATNPPQGGGYGTPRLAPK